jgi:predicted nuclease of predicted toxin-antitoxin system
MRLYLDQMLHADLAVLLRTEGHNVLTEDGHATAEDAEILSRAIDDDRVVVTLDKHFGNWLTLPLSKHSGVIRMKVSPTITDEIAPLLIPFLSRHQQTELHNRLVIISRFSERWITTA